MHKLAYLAVVAAACTDPAGEPKLVIDPGPWFIGETNVAHVEWNDVTTCSSTDILDCQTQSAPSFELASVTCKGCKLSDVQLHQTVLNAAAFSFEATTTDAIEIDVTVESGGTTYDLAMSGTGDRETGLVADCHTVFLTLLDATELDDMDLHPCDERTQWEFVLVGLEVTSEHGNSRFPFCPDPGSCSPDYARKMTQIEVSRRPQRWISSELFYTAPSHAPQPVTITAPLATGELATATVTIPPITRLAP